MVSNTVILGVTDTTKIIFDQEFPHLKQVEIVPYNITYSRFFPLTLKLLLSSVRIFRVVLKEKKQLLNIIKACGIDIVISDNRLGMYNSKIESIYITHQLNIQAGIFSYSANIIHHYFIKKFNIVWVPDSSNTQKNLAGKLSRSEKFNDATYLGPLSRLKPSVETIKKFNFLLFLSGVEPQRSMLEKKLMAVFNLSDKNICLIRGSNSEFGYKLKDNFTVINFATADEMSYYISNSNITICRSGYSTLMDMFTLKQNNIILIPTPGQPEQLYLAKYWQQTFGIKVIYQKNILALQNIINSQAPFNNPK